MKKTLLFVAALGMSVAANAQTESAFMDPVALLGEDAKSTPVAVEAGFEFCKSASVSMKAAFDESYKIVSMSGSSDFQKGLSIDGTYYEAVTGVQGQSNPQPNEIGTGQTTGAVFRFDVTKDGMLYVFGKISGNKNYYVWEGDVFNGAGMPVAYSMTAFLVGDGKKVGYTLPSDADGYYVKGSGYDDGVKFLMADQCTEIAAGLADATTVPATKSCTVWDNAGGNALGVIAFPVYADAGQYYVNACGSKVTCDGFVFIPGATTVAAVSNEAGASSISSVKAASKSVVVYNILGQRVADNAKGLLIINGKKVVRK